jgi:hypothetical protein
MRVRGRVKHSTRRQTKDPVSRIQTGHVCIDAVDMPGHVPDIEKPNIPTEAAKDP